VKLEESHEETNERKTGRPVLCEKMFCMKLADNRKTSAVSDITWRWYLPEHEKVY